MNGSMAKPVLLKTQTRTVSDETTSASHPSPNIAHMLTSPTAALLLFFAYSLILILADHFHTAIHTTFPI
jgi:hypothetical protein